MSRLDQETADLIAAKAVREALKVWPDSAFASVEDAVAGLFRAGRLDAQTAAYVLKNVDRFRLCPPPRWFDATWYLAAPPY
ncbi:MAG: hypothetical protein ABIZ04_17010 [Opitutus sp.]